MQALLVLLFESLIFTLIDRLSERSAPFEGCNHTCASIERFDLLIQRSPSVIYAMHLVRMNPHSNSLLLLWYYHGFWVVEETIIMESAEESPGSERSPGGHRHCPRPFHSRENADSRADCFR